MTGASRVPLLVHPGVGGGAGTSKLPRAPLAVPAMGAELVSTRRGAASGGGSGPVSGGMCPPTSVPPVCVTYGAVT